MNKREPIYKVIFINQGQVYEMYAKQIYQSDLWGFLEIEEFVFGERTQVVVDPSEEKLKAAYVFNFLKFTTWPALADGAPLEVCLANANEEVKVAFSLIDGQKANGHPVQVRLLPVRGGTRGCQVYYLREGGVPVALNQLVKQDRALLTIGDGLVAQIPSLLHFHA